MTDWQPIETAPRGEMIEKINAKTKKTYMVHKSVRIIGCANDHTTETYWIPPEQPKNEWDPKKPSKPKVGRWHKFNAGVELDGWCHLPDPLTGANK